MSNTTLHTGPSKEERFRHIGLGYLSIGELERRYINEVLDNNRLSSGRFTAAFEREFARLHNCKHAIFCSSGTAALHLGLAALKEYYHWSDGDEVIVPSLTWISTSNIVFYNGMRPVFADVDPIYYNLDANWIDRVASPRTRAIIPVHLFGLPCDMDPIMEKAAKFGLKVMEDSAETMFARYKGRPVGSFGEIGCFSTYMAHILVTGVGGFAVTSNDKLAVIMRSLMAHGRDSIYLTIDDDDDLASKDHLKNIVERRFSFDRLGYNFRLTEMEAALGLAQLRSKDEMIQKRKYNAAYLNERLNRFSECLQLPTVPPTSDHVFMMYPIVIKKQLDREDLMFYLEERGIETRYMLPLLNQKIYRKLFGDIEDQYPVARHIDRNGFYIGCHQGLTNEDLDYVVEQFENYIGTNG